MLKRVSIQNFKSLKDVTLDLQKVNLLIGPNNSGKTNFLKALEFMSKYVSGFQALQEQRANKNYQKLENDFLENNASFSTLYSYRKRPDETISIILYKESLDNKISYNYKWNKSVGGVTKFINDKAENIKYGEPTVISDLLEVFTNFHLYRPDPNKLDKPAPVGEGTETVNADASNIVAFLDYILSEYRTTFNQIEDDLRKCVPEFIEINLQNIKPTEELVKQFGDKTFKRLGLTDSRKNVKYWADELSEGTLYFLALLCIINQPNPPKLLLLEEPEKGIHPRRIREVMDFIFRLAEEKDIQIILTTHNENVLNEFTSMPEAVFVFSKDDEGATHVKNLQRDIIEPSNQRSRETGTKEIDFTSNLGESWMYGLLGGVPEESL